VHCKIVSLKIDVYRRVWNSDSQPMIREPLVVREHFWKHKTILINRNNLDVNMLTNENWTNFHQKNTTLQSPLVMPEIKIIVRHLIWIKEIVILTFEFWSAIQVVERCKTRSLDFPFKLTCRQMSLTVVNFSYTRIWHRTRKLKDLLISH
jgi:hypothetical protein